MSILILMVAINLFSELKVMIMDVVAKETRKPKEMLNYLKLMVKVFQMRGLLVELILLVLYQ